MVAVVALVLLAAGGYGVVQQRAATQDEIRQLQAALATAASPAEVAQTREALQEMEQANARQLASIEALTLENRRLQDTVAGLETQLAAQQPTAAPVEPKPSPPPKSAAKPKPAATPKPASTPKPAARPATGSATGGEWFVNFSSYGQRAAAEKLGDQDQAVRGQGRGATDYQRRQNPVPGTRGRPGKPGRGGEGCGPTPGGPWRGEAVGGQRIARRMQRGYWQAPAQLLMFSHSSIQGHDHE